jgi:hypothetical protein
MSTPYGGNDPQQWGQQSQDAGSSPNPQSGGFPAQDYPQQGGYPQQPGYGQQPQWGQQPGGYQQQYPQQTQWGQQPGAYPQSGSQPQYGAYPQTGPQQGYFGQPAQTTQWGAPPGYGAPPAGEPKKSNKGIWIGAAVLIVVVAAFCVTAFWVPGFFVTKVFDATKQGNDVKGILTNTYQIPNVANVTCPSDQEVKSGNTFDCTATIGGKQQKVTVKVKDADGNYEVGTPK